MELGSTKMCSGFVTRQLNLQGQSLEEIERRLGFHTGRLKAGAEFYVAQKLPAPHQFDLAGYTQVADQHTKEKYGDINNPADPMLLRKKELAADQWSEKGYNRLVKVIPVTRHDNSMKLDIQYPPGTVIQQWKITEPILFTLEQIVLDYPNGRFIPLQGFEAVRYK